MGSTIHQPHDKLFRSALQNKRVAIDFFKAYLPKELLAITDLSKLKLQNTSMIDITYKAFEADIIYKVEFGKREGYLYTLFEHLTEPDKMVNWRIHRYMILLIENHIAQNKNSLPLPLVYPIIVYTGRKPYTFSADFFDLFGEENKTLAKNCFMSPQFIDVCRKEDDELKKHHWFGLAELAFKYRNLREFAIILDKLLPYLHELTLPKGDDFRLSVLKYITDGISEGNLEIFVDKIKYYSPEMEEETMTIAEQLRKEGREQALQETRTIAEQLRKEGREQALQETRTIAEQSRKEGRDQVMKQEMRRLERLVLKLRSEGMSVEKISQLIELTPAEITRILQEIPQTSDSVN